MKRIVTLLTALALATAGCGGSDEAAEEAPRERATTTEAGGVSGCTDAESPPAKPVGNRKPPSTKLDPAKRHTVTFKTNCGRFTVELDVKTSPRTAASFYELAETGFFDDTVFHRIVPGFVIQGGDPTGTGTGGPGYQTVDPPPADAAYTKGVVAMAKTQAEAPGTSGSQFFVVTGADIGLPPDYAMLGKVSAGLGVVERIGELGDPDGRPTHRVVIEDASAETE